MSESSTLGLHGRQQQNITTEQFPKKFLQHQQGEVAERLKATVC